MYNAICTGKFSSDRTIREYAKDIWKIEQFEIKISTEQKETLPLIKSEAGQF